MERCTLLAIRSPKCESRSNSAKGRVKNGGGAILIFFCCIRTGGEKALKCVAEIGAAVGQATLPRKMKTGPSGRGVVPSYCA